MTLSSITCGWSFAFILGFKLFHGAWGDCGPPIVVPNTNPVEQTSGTPGERVVYSCDRNTGYYEIPNKSTTITCQDDGTWTNIEEFCTKGCGVPDRLSYAEPKQDDLEQNIFLPNANVTYSCRPGFIRIPGLQNSRTCLQNYTWSTTVFCRRKSCGNPGEVENGNMEADGFDFGSRVTYTCNEGYRLSNRRNFRDCLADGGWSNSLPQCDAVICGPPDAPINGTYSPQKDEYTYLDSVTFSCQKFSEVVGNSVISCSADGDWSSASPICKEVQCQNPDVPNSERLSGFQGPYTLNSAIAFKCKEGFSLRGPSSISCNIDSQWVPSIPKCEVIELCGEPGTIPNTQFVTDYRIGSKAIYNCIHGYAFLPSSSVNYRICQEDRTWSDAALVCAAICEKPPTLHFASLIGSLDFYFNGTVVSFTCKAGFVPNSTKEATMTCIDHSWSNPDEFCTRISCGHPGNVENGYVMAPDYTYGSHAVYTCEEGHKVNTTLDYIICHEDGQWSGPIGCTPHGHTNIGLIVGSIFGGIVGVAICILLVKWYSKKHKTGNVQTDAPSVQYSHCNA